MSKKKGRHSNSFESMGYDPEVMKKFGYESLGEFLAVEAKISPEQMKLFRICNQNATIKSPKRSIQILDVNQKGSSSLGYASPTHALQ